MADFEGEVAINLMNDKYSLFNEHINTLDFNLLPLPVREKVFKVFIEYLHRDIYSDVIMFSGDIQEIPDSLKEKFVEVILKHSKDNILAIRNLARSITENEIVNFFDKFSDDTKNDFFLQLLNHSVDNQEVAELLLSMMYTLYNKLDSSLQVKSNIRTF